MSPEQLMGKAVVASDQYALGIVLYEWLTGSVPFTGSFPEICSQHLLAQPPSVLGVVSNLPSGVDHVIQKALAKDPQQRFARVADFAEAFELASQGDDPTYKIAQDDAANALTYKKPDVGNPPFEAVPGWQSPLPNQPALTPPPPPGYQSPSPNVPFSILPDQVSSPTSQPSTAMNL
jgi:serine/threonine protein kinase